MMEGNYWIIMIKSYMRKWKIVEAVDKHIFVAKVGVSLLEVGWQKIGSAMYKSVVDTIIAITSNATDPLVCKTTALL